MHRTGRIAHAQAIPHLPGGTGPVAQREAASGIHTLARDDGIARIQQLHLRAGKAVHAAAYRPRQACVHRRGLPEFDHANRCRCGLQTHATPADGIAVARAQAVADHVQDRAARVAPQGGGQIRCRFGLDAGRRLRQCDASAGRQGAGALGVCGQQHQGLGRRAACGRKQGEIQCDRRGHGQRGQRDHAPPGGALTGRRTGVRAPAQQQMRQHRHRQHRCAKRLHRHRSRSRRNSSR